MVRSKKEGKIKTKKIVKKAIVSSVSQTWSKYIKNKKEKAMITKLVKKIENKDRFVSSKKKKFEIYFPFLIVFCVKILRIMPYRLYFYLWKKIGNF